jgi:uncharacterized protein (DUF952 family)
VSPRVIYKIVPRDLWLAAEAAGRFTGAPVDLQDGYIHFSTSSQVAETAIRYFSGLHNLVLVAILVEHLSDNLRYEIARGGELFPHLYSDFTMDAVLWVRPITTRTDGIPVLPQLEQDS